MTQSSSLMGNFVKVLNFSQINNPSLKRGLANYFGTDIKGININIPVKRREDLYSNTFNIVEERFMEIELGKNEKVFIIPHPDPVFTAYVIRYIEQRAGIWPGIVKITESTDIQGNPLGEMVVYNIDPMDN